VGPLPLPGYLAATWRTIEEANRGGAEVRLVRDETLPSLLPELHPSYEHLSYVHRADYVRMALLDRYGGLWLDLETVALRNFSSLFRSCTDDGMTVPSHQGVIGPLRPNTTTTRAWKALVHAKLDAMKANLKRNPGGVCKGNHCDYALGWQAILGNVWRQMEKGVPGLKPMSSICVTTCGYGCPIACYNKAEPKCNVSASTQPSTTH